MHAVVTARVELPDVPVPTEQIGARGDVEDRAERVIEDVVALEARAPRRGEIDRRRLPVAEVPAFAARPTVWTVGREERTEAARLARLLVVAEEWRARAALPAFEPEEREQRVAASMVVDVFQVGIPDRLDAVRAAAIFAVRQANAGGAVRGGKRESATLRHEFLDFSGGKRKSRTRRRCRLQESALRRSDANARSERRESDQNESDICEDTMTGLPDHGNSPWVDTWCDREGGSRDDRSGGDCCEEPRRPSDQRAQWAPLPRFAVDADVPDDRHSSI